MDIFTDPTAWIVAGAILMIAELVIPGGIVVFLGAACLLVSGAVAAGLVATWTGALTLFFISSIVLIVSLRSLLMRFAGGDFSLGNTVEILDDVGQRVLVVETIGPGNTVGRITFRGTQWPAVSGGGEISAGGFARIVSRENVQYIVEPFVAESTSP